MKGKNKINIAITGGPCTGKSTLAAMLFAVLEAEEGLNFDLITDEAKSLRKEFGKCRSPFDRFYLWRQQEREELRSGAKDGFITDYPLFHFYIAALQHARSKRDDLAVRELFRMCMEVKEKDRYQLIVMADDPREFPYKNDYGRKLSDAEAGKNHRLIRNFLEHFWPQEALLFVKEDIKKRVEQTLAVIKNMRGV